MIIHHQKNIAAFAGNHIYFDMLKSIVVQQISVTSASVANQAIEQARSKFRFIFSRIFGRVN